MLLILSGVLLVTGGALLGYAFRSQARELADRIDARLDVLATPAPPEDTQ